MKILTFLATLCIASAAYAGAEGNSNGAHGCHEGGKGGNHTPPQVTFSPISSQVTSNTSGGGNRCAADPNGVYCPVTP
jgi:hypothetical protein